MDKDILMLAASIGGAWVSWNNFTQAKALEASDPARAAQKKQFGYLTGAASLAASLYGIRKVLKAAT